MAEDVPQVSEWFSIPEAADKLGVADKVIRNALSTGALVGVRRGAGSPVAIPSEFLMTDDAGECHILETLKGTLSVLFDAGYSHHECLVWLFTENESLGSRPVDALRTGRTHEVRRVAQALAF